MIFIKDTKINGPIAMVSDNNGNIYVSNYNTNNVVKITPSGMITPLINNVDKPYGMNITDGMLFVSSQGTNSVLRYKL
jgi:streptogramin lyase